MLSKKIKDVKNLFGSNYVYVLLNDVGLIKIGITDKPYNRFISIQNSSGSMITD